MIYRPIILSNPYIYSLLSRALKADGTRRGTNFWLLRQCVMNEQLPAIISTFVTTSFERAWTSGAAPNPVHKLLIPIFVCHYVTEHVPNSSPETARDL